MADPIDPGGGAPISELIAPSQPTSNWQGVDGLWLKHITVLDVPIGSPGRWLILEGVGLEGVDQISDAQVSASIEPLATAYAVAVVGDGPDWYLAMELPQSGEVVITLPYAIRSVGALFCTGFRILKERPRMLTPRLVVGSASASFQFGDRVRTRVRAPIPAPGEGKRLDPPMAHRRKGLMLGEVSLEHGAFLEAGKLIFPAAALGARFLRPLRPTEVAFSPGHLLTFRPLISGGPGVGITVELLDERELTLAGANFPNVGNHERSTFRLLFEVTRPHPFLFLRVVGQGGVDDTIIDEIKCRITYLDATVAQTNRLFD